MPVLHDPVAVVRVVRIAASSAVWVQERALPPGRRDHDAVRADLAATFTAGCVADAVVEGDLTLGDLGADVEVTGIDPTSPRPR